MAAIQIALGLFVFAHSIHVFNHRISRHTPVLIAAAWACIGAGSFGVALANLSDSGSTDFGINMLMIGITLRALCEVRRRPRIR